jgi:hypothetical protein
MTVRNEVGRLRHEIAMGYSEIPTRHLLSETEHIQESQRPNRDSLQEPQEYNKRRYYMSQLARPLRKTKEKQEADMMKTKEKHYYEEKDSKKEESQ